MSREEQEKWKRMYEEQKHRTQEIIREEIYKYEEKITTEIKESEDNGRKMWKYINKLKGKEEKKDDVKLLGEDGKEI